ncbi:DUF1501 domain-containing protein [Stratiformator vulcanicus]|uniref:Sulfatase n=1 Tax=Stratiformator vulcanicus TaxID=2527980 RepID=A0A517R1Y8_9PLAN|nr:DUF1501 domain-containing protein [Stratiformator vulcanicus]QDT37864.1 hypothetical protein Pan189_22470 [Stratiformator vulcanicus]
MNNQKTQIASPIANHLRLENRRQFFGRSACGLGTAALASLLGPTVADTASGKETSRDTSTGGLHHAPKAKRAIYLFMSGAPSQIDTFDYKPKLRDMFDEDLPQSVIMGQRLTTMTSGQDRLPIAPSKYDFRQCGDNGTRVSELLPNIGKMVDDIAIVRSVWTEAINHDPAITYIQTGSQIPGRASLGAWLSYGLGSLNANLPTFVVLNSTWSAKRDAQALYSRLWGSGFLPSKHQGVALRSQGDPVLYLSNPPGVDRELRRVMLDGVGELNRKLYDEVGDPETQTRISQYEMAFRMQASVPELTDLSTEPESTFDLYGPEAKTPGTFAYNCVLARRMMERDVRFVQIFHRGWDQHNSLPRDLPLQCGDIDRPSYALVQDLKQRGLLEETLVVWGGEFGRTTYCQGKLTAKTYGRDHHPRCFSTWMAGGGIRGGVVHGETDDFSYNITQDPVHINDLNATILNQLGIDHRKLSFKYQGLDQRLTGVEPARVVKEILS